MPSKMSITRIHPLQKQVQSSPQTPPSRNRNQRERQQDEHPYVQPGSWQRASGPANSREERCPIPRWLSVHIVLIRLHFESPPSPALPLESSPSRSLSREGHDALVLRSSRLSLSRVPAPPPASE